MTLFGGKQNVEHKIHKMIINPLFVTIKYNPIYVIPRCCICLENVTTNRHQCGVCSHFTHIQCIKKWKKSCQVFVTLQSLDTFLTEGFNVLKKSKHKLFGIYPVYNPFFCTIKDTQNKHISYNLKFIVGTLCGVINSRVSEMRNIEQKEDYERTIKYYLETGGVVRFNNITVETKYYKEPGGLQALGLRSWAKENKSVKYLVKTYPDFCFVHKKKNIDPKTKKPWPEIQLRDTRKNK